MRLLIALLLLSATACSAGDPDSGDSGSEGSAGSADPRAMKADVDDAVRVLVPALADAFGAQVDVGNSVGFLECSVAGSWRYEADGALVGEQAPDTDARGVVERVLGEHGFEIDTSDRDRVRGTKASAVVIVDTLVTTAGGVSYRRYHVGTGCTALSGDAADYARQQHQPDFSDLETRQQ